MFCIQCGNKLPDDAMFCNGCGSTTKPSNQSAFGPMQSSRTTIQFDNHGQAIPPQMNSGPQALMSQFGAAQSGTNPNNQQLPPTQMAPTQFASNPNNPQYPPMQTGLNQSGSGQQMPPTQMAPAQMSSNPNYPLVPPTQRSSNPGNPQYAPMQTGPNQFGSGQQVPPTQPSSNPNYPQYPPVTGPNPYGDASSNPQGQSTPYGVRSPYESTQYSSDPNSQPWQTSFPPAAPAIPAAPPPPPGALQQWLMRTVGPNLASNSLFGVSLGGVLAAIIGALASLIIVSIAHAIASHTALINGMTSEYIVDNALGLVSLHNLFRDGLQLLLVMNGVGIHTQFDTGAYSYVAPLNGLLIIPAILLTFGGYVAAGTDVRNNVQSSLLRGASIAIPYTILLFLMTTQVNGCFESDASKSFTALVCTPPAGSVGQLSMDTTTLLLFGLLWGILFGLLGASIKLARGQWRQRLYQYLRSNQRPQIVGSFVGGLVAIGIGFTLSFLVVCCFVAYTSYSSLMLSHIPIYSNPPFNGDWATLTLWTITQGPLYGLNVFFFSLNAPYSVIQPTTYNSTDITHIALSLFGTTPSISPWFRLLLAIPVICLFLGGRASAAIGRVQTTGSGAIQGALIAIPFTVLMMLLTTLSTNTATFVPGSTTNSNNAYAFSAGVGAFDLFLWTLLAGAILGALGGMYQTGAMNATMSKILAPLGGLLRLLSKPGYALFARFSKQPYALQHTTTKDWLFSTVFCSFILLIGAGVVGGVLVGLNQTLTLDQNVRIRDITSVVLIAIPGLLLLCTCAAALRHDPVLAGGMQSSVSMPVSPPSYPTFPQQPQYQQYPQQPQIQSSFPTMPAAPPISQMPQYPQQPQPPQYQQYPQQPQQPQF